MTDEDLEQFLTHLKESRFTLRSGAAAFFKNAALLWSWVWLKWVPGRWLAVSQAFATESVGRQAWSSAQAGSTSKPFGKLAEWWTFFSGVLYVLTSPFLPKPRGPGGSSQVQIKRTGGLSSPIALHASDYWYSKRVYLFRRVAVIDPWST